LAAVHAALASDGDLVIAVVHGLGGMGKTTLAAHCAAAQAGARNPVWWITADTPDTVQTGLAALATALQPELAQTVPLEALAQRATAWLAAHHGWLLILDNVVHPDHIAPLLARAKSGHVLVTSRLGEGWHRLHAQTLQLEVLAQDQAVDLLTRIVNSTAALDGAAELVTELGCLPLAVEQSAAYLHQTRISPRAYLTQLAEQPAAMYDQTARGGDAERTMARIWRITLDHLSTVPLAGDLLRVLAWYGAEAIPRTLLDGLAAPFEVAGALGSLAAYNMVTLDEYTVTVHRLVQAVARTPDPADPHRTSHAIERARDQAAMLLHSAVSKPEGDLEAWTAYPLIRHIDALAEHAPAETDSTTTVDLFGRAAVILLRQGPRATRFLSRAVAGARRVLGEDHPHTLAFRNDLATAYRTAGDLDRAIPLYEQVLEDTRRALGEDHPHTLAFRSDLASAFQAAGDSEQAIPLYEQTLSDCVRILGDDHPITQRVRASLGISR
jgi:tetratricopeptide (TPR) repeat protein